MVIDNQKIVMDPQKETIDIDLEKDQTVILKRSGCRISVAPVAADPAKTNWYGLK